MTELKINRSELIKTLSVASSMAGKDKSHPILDDVKCEVKANALTCTSFNMQIAVTSRCEIDSSTQDVSFCIEPRELLEFIKLIGSEDVITIDINDECTLASIVHSNGEMTFSLLPAKDFIMPVKEESVEKISIPCATISDWVRHSQRFVAHDDLRPQLSSMYLYVKNGECGYCATDAQKLITENIEYEDTSLDRSALIPSSAFDAISSIASNKGNDMNIKFTSNTIVFQSGGSAVLCLCTQGNFPDFKSILPKDAPIMVTGLDTGAFYDAIQRASLVKNGKTCIDKTLKISVLENQIEMLAEDMMTSRKAIETVSCICDSPLTIGFNCNFLKDALSCVEDDTICLNFINKAKPMIIKEKENASKIILLMPQILRK